MHSITNVIYKWIKSFYDKNPMIKITKKPDRNSQKLPFCTALKAKIECPFIPPFGPQPPHTQMVSEAFWSCTWSFPHRLFHQRLCHLVKFLTFQWLSFEWIFLQDCRYLKIDTRLQKDFVTVVSKFAPECGVKQGAKLNIDYFVLHQRNFVIILTALFYICTF